MSPSDWDEIIINSGGSFIFDHVEMYASRYGIKPRYTSGTIKNSKFENNYVAAYLYHADNITIRNCDFIDNTYGTYVYYSNDIELKNNHYNTNNNYSIYFNNSSGELVKNVIEYTDRWDGLYLSNNSYADLSTVYDPGHVELNNELYYNIRNGVKISSSSDADLGTYLFTGTEIFGGFNYFHHGPGLYDVYNYSSNTIKAEANWWGAIWNYGNVDTDPSANALGYSLPKSVSGDQSDYIEDLLAEAYYLEKVDSNYRAAINVLNEIARRVPDDPVNYKVVHGLNRLYTKLDDTDGLLDNLNGLHDIFSKRLVGRIAYDHSGSIYARRGELSEALERLDLSIAEYTNLSGYEEETAWALLEQGMLHLDMNGNTLSEFTENVASQNSFSNILTNYSESEAAWTLTEFLNLKIPKLISSDQTSDFQISVPSPNPFNPITTIEYALPAEANVSLIVYDITGREVARLVDSREPAGFYHVTWDGRAQNGQLVSSGMYLYRIQAINSAESETANFSETGKMVFIR